ncbi:MAG TPA: polysaccharide deacetylase family protein [Patescibacteria group bacterium]|nr:polysaccharide deacetylase family protein [Patescibacteria group bacterium]
MTKGTFCISIDTELLWGRKDLDIQKFTKKVKKEREVIKKLLKLFNKYNISVTWAIVGKLYEGNDPLWSGKDIISWIKKEKIHELGSHSYSHEIFNLIPSKKANQEIKKNKAKSFVYPRNKIKYLSLLKKHNFIDFRGKDKSEFELILPRIPPTQNPKKNSNLIEIPSSMYFVSARGIRKFIIFKNLRYIKSVLGINKAIKNHEIFHIWFHPIDLVDDSENLLNELEKILKYANKKRNEKKIQILTMEQISRSYK